jgi:hypothetical protein
MTTEQKLEEVKMEISGGRTFQAEETAYAKAPR